MTAFNIPSSLILTIDAGSCDTQCCSIFTCSCDSGRDQQNIPDNVPVRGLGGALADTETLPGAFANSDRSLNAEDALRSAMYDAPGELLEDDHSIDPPAGV